MEMMLAFVLEHWIITGWMVFVACLVYSQNENVITASVKAGTSTYENCVSILVMFGVIWLIVSLIAVVKTIWFAV
ncbi:hypothetical protein N8W35_10040 [Enterobacter roggenkampii]|uniref:hypothetical protein n=1 Tax=Enterobacter roggenkampii TaxID=1812935 RepID=UPI0021C913D9|nr:hypothetical protein [Enterobacter roggenkampii]MCU3853445.1 hypothetical protein [Enterobacter roggenkampii]